MAENTGTGTARYAAYDNRLKRFVGGVHDAESKARKAGTEESKANGSKSEDLEIRKV